MPPMPAAPARWRDQHGDEGRRHGMGIEILHRLDILGRERHQIAGAAAQQIGGCKRSSLANSAMRISASRR